jgi:hypothetical protein
MSVYTRATIAKRLQLQAYNLSTSEIIFIKNNDIAKPTIAMKQNTALFKVLGLNLLLMT